ncbi:MAG: hypothetical protein ACI8RZ_007190 [Myxococcota bacterium]|jgi:hypothetical protein
MRSLLTVLIPAVLAMACGGSEDAPEALVSPPEVLAPAPASFVASAPLKPDLRTETVSCYALPSATVHCRERLVNDMPDVRCAVLPEGTACDAGAVPDTPLDGGFEIQVMGAAGEHIAMFRKTDYHHAALVVSARTGAVVLEGDVLGQEPVGSFDDGAFTVQNLMAGTCTTGPNGNEASWRSGCLAAAKAGLAASTRPGAFTTGTDASALSTLACTDARYAEVSGLGVVGAFPTVRVELETLERAVVGMACGSPE